jgi:hypothetical protein
MESLMLTELTVPLSQIALLLIFSTVALLLGRVKLALLVNYLFALHWGYVYNRQLFLGSDLEKMDYFDACYFGFGLAIVVFASIGFLMHRH